jgi:hypothetical protein
MIAMEKPKAMTTSSVRAFLLETFLIALVKVPTIVRLAAVFLKKSRLLNRFSELDQNPS